MLDSKTVMNTILCSSVPLHCSFPRPLMLVLPTLQSQPAAQQRRQHAPWPEALPSHNPAGCRRCVARLSLSALALSSAAAHEGRAAAAPRPRRLRICHAARRASADCSLPSLLVLCRAAGASVCEPPAPVQCRGDCLREGETAAADRRATAAAQQSGQKPTSATRCSCA